NTYYAWTSNGARGVFCQEIGHTFGLDHSNDGGCMGGGYWYDISTHYTLVSGNINEINSMYANRSLVGPEPAPPRLHAFWVTPPHSLREAARMSTVVVVATARGAEEGEPIVFDAEHGVAPIPTQRVTFDVVRPYKGDLVAGESFVLFQNGNEANRFE